LNVIHVDLSFYHAVTLLSSEMYKERWQSDFFNVPWHILLFNVCVNC
jgi:hypothetical protein